MRGNPEKFCFIKGGDDKQSLFGLHCLPRLRKKRLRIEGLTTEAVGSKKTKQSFGKSEHNKKLT